MKDLYKLYDEKQIKTLDALRATLTDAQNSLLDEFLYIYKKKNSKIVYRNYVDGFITGLRIGLNYKGSR